MSFLKQGRDKMGVGGEVFYSANKSLEVFNIKNKNVIEDR